MPFRFKGGIDPESNKDRTYASPIMRLETPAEVAVPLSQHHGAPCVPLVEAGDRVFLGQKIGDGTDEDSCPVHASVSGRVISVGEEWHPSGIRQPAIVIRNDFEDRLDPSCTPVSCSPEQLGPEEIIDMARDAGLVGMGGGSFPLYVKLKNALRDGTDLLVINGVECEPFVTADHRAMVEYPNAIVGGIKIVMRCLKPQSVCVAIGDDKPDAIATMRSMCEGTGINVVAVPAVYPQGGEKQLFEALTGHEVPVGKRPSDMGCVIINVDTCASLFRKISRGTPLIKRVVTVSGPAVVNPRNLLVRIGTRYSELFDACGGFSVEPTKIVDGGPMRGYAQHTLDTPVTKGTTSLIAFCEKGDDAEGSCIRCGRCIRVCPMRLMPNYLYFYAKAGRYDTCLDFHVRDCMECGCCSYVCPGNLYLVQAIRKAKSYLKENTPL